MDISDLIRNAQIGDELALESLLKTYRNQLRQSADQALPDRLRARLDASDIVQQTCLSIFRQIGEFQGSDPAQFVAWLRKIHERNIQNAIRDQLQTQKRGDGQLESLAGLDVPSEEQETPSRHAMQREDALHLSQALDRLPADEREVLRLRYLEGRTLIQVGDELGLTKDAVVWLMQKGMKRLRQWLPREDEDKQA